MIFLSANLLDGAFARNYYLFKKSFEAY